MCAITAIPLEKSKVLFGLEELEEFSVVDETDAQAAAGDLGRMACLEKWGWIMFECGIENLTVKGATPRRPSTVPSWKHRCNTSLCDALCRGSSVRSRPL